MEFLDKLYESNYFGIGLFAVICFLVVTFLIVLFFGKKDEKKRKLEETAKLESMANTTDTFKETTPIAPVEVNQENVVSSVEPVAPINESIEPVAPINYEDVNSRPVNYDTPVISNDIPKVAPVIPEIEENVFPTVEPINVTPMEQVNSPIINEPVKPIIPEVDEKPIYNNPVINNESNVYSAPEPTVLEPMHFNIPVEPIIKEEPKTIVTPSYKEETPTIIEEPVRPSTYYKPVEKMPIKEDSVPDIDFDAIAKSISKELDELENVAKNKPVQPVGVASNSTPNQFSSVYVSDPIKKPVDDYHMDLPDKIDLPTRKDN